jgi:uncharacterized membrane protein
MTTHLLLRLGHGLGMGWHGVAFRWFAILVFLAFVAALVLGVAMLWRHSAGTAATARPPTDEALSLVRMRYARGEMTTQEFLEASEALGGPPAPQPPATPAPPA